MKPDAPLKLVSQLLDLAIIDSEGNYCGIVDDVELEGKRELKVNALLVGPGAYSGRLPGWAMALVKLVAGDGITRVPVTHVIEIASAVKLDRPARELGLNCSEAAAERWIPRLGAM